jgi:hypothetical protein
MQQPTVSFHRGIIKTTMIDFKYKVFVISLLMKNECDLIAMYMMEHLHKVDGSNYASLGLRQLYTHSTMDMPCNEVLFLQFRMYQKSLDFRLDSGSSWLDGVNGILMQQEPNSPKQDYWNQRAIASLANTLFTVVEPVPKPLLSSMLLIQL